MPKGKHSRLQLKLCNQINKAAEPQHLAYAFPELRCSFGGRSIVLDIAVFQWLRIPCEADGEAPNDFLRSPDWVIEILSPNQSSNQVTGKILDCLDHGCQLGWLLEPQDRSALVFCPDQVPQLQRGQARLPVLEGLALVLTVDQIFSWLQMVG